MEFFGKISQSYIGVSFGDKARNLSDRFNHLVESRNRFFCEVEIIVCTNRYRVDVRQYILPIQRHDDFSLSYLTTTESFQIDNFCSEMER